MNKSKIKGNDLEYIESLLKDTLKPITPRKEFVQQLGVRLRNQPLPIIQKIDHEWTEFGLLALVSILGGFFIFITNTRTIISFIGALSVLQFLKQQTQQKQLQPPTPAL